MEKVFYNIHTCDAKTMCYIVFISHSLLWRYIKIVLHEYVITFYKGHWYLKYKEGFSNFFSEMQ